MVCSVAWCSMRELIIRVQPKSLIAAKMAVLLLSVPPLVKNISEFRAPSKLATDFRAFSMAMRLSRP